VIPHPSEQEVGRKLEEVLSRPEFSGADDPDWLMRLLEWLRPFFDWLGSLWLAAPFLFWLLLIGCIVVLGLLLFYIGWSVRRAFFAERSLRAGERADARRAQLSQAYWEEARRRAEQGDYTEAIRFLFLSLVYRFDERGRVRIHEAYTNREYLSLFADRPAVYDKLRVFVDTLDHYWYGQRATDEPQYEQCLALYAGLTTA
jgi:hypothetical protein